MRINVRIYYIDPINKQTSSALLLPTESSINNATRKKEGEPPKQTDALDTIFDIPADIDTNKNFKFFANRPTIYCTNDNIDGWELWNGGVRNLMIINTFCSDMQLRNIFSHSIATYYNWAEFGEYNLVEKINKNSYLGCVYAYNTKTLNALHTSFKANTQTLSGITFNE